MVIIGFLIFLSLAPAQFWRERAWRQEHPGEPLSKELRYGRYIFATMGVVIVLAFLIGG